VGAIAIGSPESGPLRTHFTLFQHDTSQQSLDLGDPGPSVGDQYVFGGDGIVDALPFHTGQPVDFAITGGTGRYPQGARHAHRAHPARSADGRGVHPRFDVTRERPRRSGAVRPPGDVGVY
jgi:hypothetical protein